jgi:hypothetical protein
MKHLISQARRKAIEYTALQTNPKPSNPTPKPIPVNAEEWYPGYDECCSKQNPALVHPVWPTPDTAEYQLYGGLWM